MERVSQDVGLSEPHLGKSQPHQDGYSPYIPVLQQELPSALAEPSPLSCLGLEYTLKVTASPPKAGGDLEDNLGPGKVETGSSKFTSASSEQTEGVEDGLHYV